MKSLQVRFRAEDTTPGPRFKWPFATCALVASNLAAWGVVAFVYGLSPFAQQNSSLLLRVGAVNGELLRAGECWRIVTSQFLHVNFPHLIFNAVALMLLGAMLEREFGAWRLIILYLCGGTVGQLVGVTATPALVSSGASQAVLALAGGALVGLFLRRTHMRRATLIILIFVIAGQVALDVFAAGHIKAGHLGGFSAGAFIGYVLLRSVKRA
ncbi:MAG: rhomboid protease GluP [Acidobacteriota bacterium]|nr:rhomboid protease GluP [Acidobacteriota bacterium]